MKLILIDELTVLCSNAWIQVIATDARTAIAGYAGCPIACQTHHTRVALRHEAAPCIHFVCVNG